MNPILIMPFFAQMVLDYDGGYISKPTDFPVEIDKQVDLAKSQMSLNQVPILLSDHRPVIHIQKEGESILQYVFKDAQGKQLEGNTVKFYLDSTAPEIRFFVDDQPVHLKTSIHKQSDLKIQIEEAHIKDVHVYIDNKEQAITWKQDQIVCSLQPKDQIVHVVSNDMAGHCSESTLDVHYQKDLHIDLSVKDEMYTLDKRVKVTFTEPLDSQYQIVLESNDQRQTIDCTQQKTMYVDLEHVGKQTLYVQKKEDLKLTSDHHHFYFTNQVPNLHFHQNGSRVRVWIEGNWIKEKKLWLNEREIPWIDHLDLPNADGQDKTYIIRGLVQDWFGQESQSQLTVHVDRKAPMITMDIDGKNIQETYTLDTFQYTHITTDEHSVIECIYFKNGKPIFASNLQDALLALSANDVLQIHVSATDADHNQSTRVYEIRKADSLSTKNWSTVSSKPQKKSEKLEPVTIRSYLNDTHSIQYRTWSFDSSTYLQIQQKELKSKDRAQPSIRVLFYRSGSKVVRILLEKDRYKSQFVYIRIDGKKVSKQKIKKDKLGNAYYQFRIKKQKVHLEIEAKNKVGNLKKIDRTIVSQNSRFKDHRLYIHHLFWRIQHG